MIDFDAENKLCRKLRVKKATLISELYEILGQQLVRDLLFFLELFIFNMGDFVLEFETVRSISAVAFSHTKR